jgi:hypothetical protein
MFTKVLLFFRPGLFKVVVLVVAMSLTLLVIVEREATSKVSWDQTRGAPFPFLVLTEYRGPCPPLNDFCIRFYFQAIYPVELLLDALIWYIVSCTLASNYIRQLVTNRFGPIQ